MNKKIILGLATALLLASSAMAYDGSKNKQQRGENFKSCKMKSNHKDSHMFVKMVMQLDLTEKQRAEVISIVKDSMQKMPNPSNAFTETSFDKKEFIKLAKEKRDANLERKADMFESIYKVLNSSQKKDLKTMLDMKVIMQKNMNKGKNCNAKNCNGRR
ncbi:MAG: Spy/CpxP family protein refolding chaperone [Sulfurimonas sp.]|nr:Spy/CpxP family protein refolding chaperone [Sulfurimonas sp.]